MKIKLKLYAALRQYVPAGVDLPALEEGWETADGATLGQVVEILNLPKTMKLLTLLNGVNCNDQARVLQNGDAILLFPLMAGG